jgi:hypothetical protein
LCLQQLAPIRLAYRNVSKRLSLVPAPSQKPLPQWLAFAHLSVAFVGFLVVSAVTLSLAH